MVSATNTSSTEVSTAVSAEDGQQAAEVELDSDTLVEEISIDGMCGVY
jgi:mycofactocin precursor